MEKNIQSQVNDHKIRISLLEQQQKNAGDNSALAGQIEDLKTQINGNAGLIEDLQNEVNGNAADNSALQNQITDLQNQITDLENKLQNVGGETEDANSDNFGQKYYNTEDISALMNDYKTESFFGNQSVVKIPLCLVDANGPKTQLFFRVNPLYTQKPHIKLWFWIAVLTTGVYDYPCVITLNGKEIVNEVLPILSEDHKAFVEFDIDPTVHPIEVFNVLEIHFKLANAEYCYWEWVKCEITNAYNPIILNRNTDFEIYGLRKSDGGHRIFSSKYVLRECRWIGGDDPLLESNSITSTYFTDHYLNGVRLRWASRSPQQNFDNKFTYTNNYHMDYFLTQENKFYARSSMTSMSYVGKYTAFVEDVLYAKKSLHNGPDQYIECACLVHTDFSLALHNAHFRNNNDAALMMLKLNFDFNNGDYPKEFVDFIPVYDHNILEQKTHKIFCGYFLHHQSGNIIFVPETNSTYFIKIGKGRQVHAFLSQDNLKIDVFFQMGNNVVQKTLTRESEESDWVLTDNKQCYLNVEDVVPFQEFYYTIKNRDIVRIEQSIT